MTKNSRRTSRIGFAALAALSLLTLPALAGDVSVKKGALVIDSGQRFFRGKATDVALGSYGEKKTPALAVPYLAVEKAMPPSVLARSSVKITGPISVDWAKVSKTDVEAGMNYLNAAGGKASLSVEKAKSARLVLVKFSLHEGDLKELLNRHAAESRSYLKKEGKDGRIVSEVYVAMEAELASKVTTGASASAKGNANGLEIEVAASSSSTTTTKISLPPDTTFAYLLHRVKKWSGDKIDDMEDDRPGAN